MATNPDVRIRLSAEGVQEVVNALKQVQTQSQKTAKDTEKIGGGFDAATKGIQELRSGVAALSGAFATLGGIGLVKSLADTAEQLGRASQRTGIAVEELSRLAYAAKTTRVEASALYDALGDFSEKMFDAASGSGDGADALKAMGFSADYAKKNIGNLPKIIGDVADKFASYADGADKTTLAVKLFGDAGKELVPLLNQGSAGIRQMMGESDELGATIRENTVKEAIKFNTELAKMTASANGLAQAILGPVIGSLNTLIGRFKEARSTGAGVFDSFSSAYKGIGFRATVEEAQSDVDEWLAIVNKQQSSWAGVTEGAMTRLNLARKNLIALRGEAAVEKRASEGMGGFGGFGEGAYKNRKQAAPDLSLGKDAEEAAKVANATADMLAAKAQMQVRLLQVKNQQLSEEDRRHFEEGLLSLTEYHARRLVAVKQEGDAEVQAEQLKLDAAKALPGNTAGERIARERAVAEAKVSLEVKVMQANMARVAAERAGVIELRAQDMAQLELRQRILEATGKQQEAAAVALDIEIAKTKELLEAQGATADERDRMLKQLKEAGQNKSNAAEATSNGNEVLRQIELTQRNIERGVKTGKYFPIEAEQRLKEAIEEQLPLLQQQVELLRQAGQTVAADELEQKMFDLAASVDYYGQSIAKLKATIQDSMMSGMNRFFDSIIEGTSSAKDAFRAFASDVVNSIRKVAQELLIQHMFRALFAGGDSSWGSMFSQLIGGGGQNVPGAVAAATGGHITGPGTGTSDSIPAWLSNGEFVVRAAAVQAVGLDALHEINRKGRLPSARVSGFSAAHVSKYADGGLVGSIADATGGGSTQVSIGLEEGLVLKKLSSPEGQRVLVEALGQNRRAVRQIIG